MNQRFFIGAAVAGALALAAILWFRATPSAPTPHLAAVEPKPAAPASAAIDRAEENAPEKPEPAREHEPVVDQSAALGHRLDEIASRLELREYRDEADRLLDRWMLLDAHAAVAWLESHRGDVRFDRLVANAAQLYIAAGDWDSAQHLVERIVESSTREWVNEEVWSAAYEQRLVSAEDLKKSGLSRKALEAIGSGSRRD